MTRIRENGSTPVILTSACGGLALQGLMLGTRPPVDRFWRRYLLEPAARVGPAGPYAVRPADRWPRRLSPCAVSVVP
jgi:hypothetical protein